MKQTTVFLVALLFSVLCCTKSLRANIPNNEIHYTSSDGKVVLPKFLNSFGTKIKNNTCENGEGVIIFESDVTSIGDDAFFECRNLKSIEFSNSITSIGESTFFGCVNLESITIPQSVISIGEMAFEGCTSLREICVSWNIPLQVDNLFDESLDCSSLVLCVPEGTDTLYQNAKVWKDCAVVQGTNNIIYYTTTDGQIAEFIGYLGWQEPTLYSNTYENGKGVLKYDGVIKRIGDEAFYDCSTLESIELPNSVTNIEKRAFLGCSSLTSIIIPEGVTSLGDFSFSDCSNLSSIEIPSSVTNIGEGAFCCCSGLKNIFVSPDNKYYDSRNNCNAIIETKTNTLISGCDYSVIPDGVKSIAYGAFEYCSNLVGITLPKSLTSIGNSAFWRCSSFEEINIPEGVEYIGEKAFYGCDNIKSIYISQNLKSIGEEAFDFSKAKLTDIIVSPDNKYYDSRDNCNALIDSKTGQLILGCKNSTIPEGVKSIADHAFYKCDSLVNIKIPKDVTSIGEYAFSECASLKNFEIPSSLKSIGEYAFYRCSSLTSIDIPNSVTSIGDYAFYKCI